MVTTLVILYATFAVATGIFSLMQLFYPSIEFIVKNNPDGQMANSAVCRRTTLTILTMFGIVTAPALIFIVFSTDRSVLFCNSLIDSFKDN